MSGRFDQENKKNKIENKIDEILKTQKQKEFASYQRQLKKIRNFFFDKTKEVIKITNENEIIQKKNYFYV